MKNTTNWLILAGLVVIAGRWARDKPMDAPAVVALFIVALALTLLSSADEELANGFSLLVLLAVTYEYVPDIVKRLNKAVSE